jgi:hypothetical protein
VLLLLTAPAMAQQPRGEELAGDSTPESAGNTAGGRSVGELTARGAAVRGSVTLGSDGSMEVLSGSQIQAGAATARLQLSRGGELLICPRTGAAISSDAGNKSLLIGINTGAIEFDSHLGAFADTILTPDLRLQLAGPGRFHLALGTAANGDTCLHALRGTEAGIIVSEVMGGGVYQLRPGDAMLFRGGKLAQAEVDTERCGCPPENPPAVPIPAATEALPVQQSAPAAPPAPLELEAPLTFQGNAPEVEQPVLLHLQSSNHSAPFLAMHPLPQPEKTAAKRGHFWRRMMRKIFP